MGVWPEPFRSGEPPHATPFAEGYLLYVGRLQEIKGVSVLLRALPKVREQRPGLGLVIVGYGAEEAALRHEARGLGLADVVHFAGRQPAPEVSRWLRGCRAAVIPSLRMPGGRAEGMPTVVLEAMAAGAPLVATRTGGIPDVVEHGRNGFLCADRDPGALATTILEALDPPPSLLEAARATADHHSWPQIANRYHHYFQHARAR